MPVSTYGEVLKNEQIASGFYKMLLHCPQIANEAGPGQFVQVQCSDGIQPLLKKPFSLASYNRGKGTITLVYQVRGYGTLQLSRFEKNRPVSLVGPLGEGFSLPENLSRALVIGGGVGAAPLWKLAEILRESSIQADVILGFNSSGEIILADEFRETAQELFITTMDGSCGINGHACVPLEPEKGVNMRDYEMVYACGPEAMLRTLAEIAEKNEIPCQVSLEKYMACGFGACLGCVCTVRDRQGVIRYDRVCMEGPVFNLEEVVFDEQA